MAVGDLWLNLLGTLRSTFRVGKAALDASALTAVRTMVLPDRAGTVALTTLGEALNTARATVASHATTADIWGASGNQINWTGAATTTAFPAAPQAGAERVLICAGACGFTAGANMLVDGVASGATIFCTANDVVIVRAVTTTQFRLSHHPLAGLNQKTLYNFLFARDAKAALFDSDLFATTTDGEGTSGVIKKTAWSLVKSTLKTYFDTLYAPIAVPVLIQVACSDETTALTAGTAKATFRSPYAFTLTGVRASVTTAPTGGTLLTVDVNETGTSVLSTKLTFDASEKTTTTAATAAVISDAAIADDAEITIDIDAVGSTIAGAGLKVTLIGTRP